MNSKLLSETSGQRTFAVILDPGEEAIQALTACLSEGHMRGGHLMDAIVRPTLEAIVFETPDYLRRTKREELGIALIDLGS
ncbi:MAG TPA: hypothetical protein VGV39_11900 [Mesorhizobium sp.]|jgi:predicted DNA-binding protein with PD1-like motif|uniref:hypothetical protein n=1 Tax=Mesorhizobium sp. TaxID=1871066 RepID=UPI002DDD418A|nr:hypothetical protein [Mesorhizobium sp.]HEV2503771.1 hypothetical protein [Mesorhizobium sp.]